MEFHDNKVGVQPNYGFSGPGYPGAQPPQGYPQYPPGTFQDNIGVQPNVGFAGPGYPGHQPPQGYSQYPPGTFQGPPVQPNYGIQGYPGGPVPPVATQPGVPGSAWMPAPVAPHNCPPGLEYLSQIDQILVHQQVELLEVLTGFETNNKYEIKNSLGQRIYFAAEENDCCTRNFCGPARSFVMTIIDNVGREVIRLQRPFRCASCLCPCCLQELEVQSPPGTTVGYVIQNWHPCLPKFTIQNERKESVLKITGPCVPCSCCADVNFEVKSLDETETVGRISKQWSGFVKEAFTDADNFGIKFPLDLDVKIKAVMLGACFLIDFMFFEHQEKNN